VITTALGLVAFGMLAAAGSLHLLRLSAFRDALTDQRLLPERFAGPTAATVSATELLIGIAGGTAFAAGADGARIGSVAAAGLFAIFTAYTAALSLISLAAAGSQPLADLHPEQVALTSVAAFALATLLWVLPDALFDPMQMPLIRTVLGQ
jgi:hypothetical protein